MADSRRVTEHAECTKAKAKVKSNDQKDEKDAPGIKRWIECAKRCDAMRCALYISLCCCVLQIFHARNFMKSFCFFIIIGSRSQKRMECDISQNS